MNTRYSIVIPAYNEEGAIKDVMKEILRLPQPERFETIIVDDRSTDGTLERARASGSATVLSNVQNFGYGYSLKRGIDAAKGDHIIILDADGSYPVSELPRLITEYEKGFDMVVGARQGSHYRGSTVKRIARVCFRLISEFATGRRIPDINSGCRIFRKDVSMGFFHTLSSGFSFTTTITLAYMLNAYSVQYIPIAYHKRQGKSKVKYVRDTLRSTQIIVEAIACYNPLKLYLLCAGAIICWGIICILLSLVASYDIVLVSFFAVALAIVVFAVGLIATFLKFTHNAQR